MPADIKYMFMVGVDKESLQPLSWIKEIWIVFPGINENRQCNSACLWRARMK